MIRVRTLGWYFAVVCLSVAASLSSDSCAAQQAASQQPVAPSETVAVDATRDDPGTVVEHGSGSGMNRANQLIASVTVFAIAVFLGFELINKVPPTLHTPLMSGSNAISGITVVGALIAAGTSTSHLLVSFFGALAVALAMINVVGGFMVTNRMLLMFRSGARPTGKR